jgi:hypothetical protein
MTAVVAGGLLLVGCSSTKTGKPSGPTGSSGQSGSTSVTSSGSTGTLTQSFDPPLVFNKQPVSELSGDVLGSSTDGINNYYRSTLDGTVIYTVTGDSLSAIDVATGQSTWNVRVDRAETMNSHVAAPALVDGKVYAAFETTIPGKGTTPEQPAITVVVADAASGQARPPIQIPTPDADPAGALASRGPTKVFGVSGSLVAVNRGAGTFGVNVDTKSLAWQRKNFITRDVIDDVVIGVDTKPVPDDGSDRVLGLRIADGKQAWAASERSPGIQVTSAGPHLVLVDTEKSADFLSAADGTLRGKLPPTVSTPLLGGTWCSYDDRSITVCKGTYRMIGIDPNSPGKPKWEIKGGGAREIPEVSAVFHGAIYGKTSNGPIVLDALTGADKPDSPVLVPTFVNEHVGIGSVEAEDGTSTLGAYAPVK